MLFNRFVLVRFIEAQVVIGGRQEYDGQQVNIPPTIEINCKHTRESEPNEATIKLYNVSAETQKRLFVEGKTVEIEAGYWPQNGARDTAVIFKGQIRKVSTKIQNDVDVVSELSFGDGDDAQARRTRGNFARGTSHADLVRYVVDSMAGDGIVAGRIFVPSYVEPRALTVDKPAWRILEDIRHQHDLQWWIQDGVLNMTPADTPLKRDALILTPDSGVLGVPEFTDDGVEIKTLMLPYLRPGWTFKLQNSKVPQRATEEYCIEEIEFSGDNRGGDFGASIKAKLVVPTTGKIKRSRNRGRRRRT